MISTPASPPPASLPQSQTSEEGIVVKEQSDARNDARNRERIGLGVLIASIGAVLVISGIVVWKGNDKETSQNVMSATLPLYGTWVGTILAFYFSRNAFESASTASSRNAEIYNQFARGLVSGASPPDNTLAKISLKSLANGLIFSENDLAKPLNNLVADMVSKERYKVIVVDAEKKYVDLISRINASAFLAPSGSNSAQPADVNSPSAPPTIKDYLDWRKNQGAKVQPIVVYLPETATLADADAKLKETPGCRDVIVTIDGTPASPVVVYVTDADINEYK
jgi:hypothetical protein